MLLETENLSKTYRMGGAAVPALRDVNLSVQEGEFLAIMGSSGSGKSTFMNIVGCLDVADPGSRYSLCGVEVSRLSHEQVAGLRNRVIGFVFQSFNLLARANAVENVGLPLLYRGVRGRERRSRAREALARVGLSSREDHLPSQLSGGQQQRVAVARALVSSPSLLLADEPTGSLDSQSSLEIMRILKELHARGMTIVLVTHEPDVARHAARKVLFHDGRVVSDTSADTGGASRIGAVPAPA